MDEKWLSWPDWLTAVGAWIAVALVLFVAYGGAYAWTARRTESLAFHAGIIVYVEYECGNRHLNELASWLFAPAHFIDEQIRPAYWTVSPEATAPPP